jgi:ribosome biogenesis GTPase A
VGPKNPTIILANKADLLPKGWTEERIRTWVKRSVQQLDPLLEHVVGIHIVSSKQNKGIASFLGTVERYRKDRDIYVIGCSNSGKSTFINLLINQHRGFINPRVDIEMPTVSPVPGTTISFLAIPTKGGGFVSYL